MYTENAWKEIVPTLKQIVRQGYCYWIDDCVMKSKVESSCVCEVIINHKERNFKVYSYVYGEKCYITHPYSSKIKAAKECYKLSDWLSEGINFKKFLENIYKPTRNDFNILLKEIKE